MALLAGPASFGGDGPSPDATEPPPFDRFVVIPLRVHILSATDLPEVDCRLGDDDVARIVRKVNRIWRVAGIHWVVESLVREPAARQATFRLAQTLETPPNLGVFRILIPDGSRKFDGLHVYYLHKFPVNGVWMGEDYVIVQETAALRPVEGGIDEPIPRVTAHELGHVLGLAHRQDRTNLLASGTTGILLNLDEVEQARRQAGRVKGAAPAPDLARRAKDASESGDRATARRLWTWLAEIPGDGGAEARRRLEALEAGVRPGEAGGPAGR